MQQQEKQSSSNFIELCCRLKIGAVDVNDGGNVGDNRRWLIARKAKQFKLNEHHARSRQLKRVSLQAKQCSILNTDKSAWLRMKVSTELN